MLRPYGVSEYEPGFTKSDLVSEYSIRMNLPLRPQTQPAGPVAERLWLGIDLKQSEHEPQSHEA